MQIQDKLRTVTDLAFQAVDADGSNDLDQEELMNVMKEVAQEMKVTPPTKDDITAVLQQLDEDSDYHVSKEEFLNLIILVLTKMLDSEYGLEDKKNNSSDGVEKLKNSIGQGFAELINKKQDDERNEKNGSQADEN